MCTLDKSDINKIARLAQISIEETTMASYLDDISNILDLIKAMDSVDTEIIEPLTHPLEIKARLRTDRVSDTEQSKLPQNIAPAADHDLYIVPQIIK